MEDHEKRVIKERDDLQAKADKLSAFLHGEKSADVPLPSLALLREQASVMGVYLSVLNRRIEAFTAE